jgi:hypothetical protein
MRERTMSEDLPFADLATVEPGYAFRRGDVACLRMRADGSLRAETWRDRWASVIAETFWPSPTFVVTAIDRENGKITVGLK